MKIELHEVRTAMAAKAINAQTKYFFLYFQKGDSYMEANTDASISLNDTGEFVDIRTVTGPFSHIKTRNVFCVAKLI